MHRDSIINRSMAPIGFALTVALFIVSGALSYFHTKEVIEAARWVSHSHQVLTELEGVLSTLKDAETGQRGFLLTESDAYLKPYRQAIDQMPAQLQELKDLTAENDFHQAAIARLETQVKAKLLELADVLAIFERQKDLAQVKDFIRTDRGLREMEAIREVIDEMESHERDLLNTRSIASRRSYHTATASNLLTVILGITFITTIFYTLRRFLAVRERARRFIASEQERFRVTLASIGDAVIVTDTEGKITFLNEVAGDLTGWHLDAFDRPISEVFRIVHEASGAIMESPVDKVLREGMIVGLANHTLLITRDGKRIPIDDSGAPIHDQEGNIIGVVLVFRDFTERRQSEAALEALQQYLSSSLNRERQVTSRLQQIASVSLTINASISLDSVLRVITEEARRLIPAHQSASTVMLSSKWDEGIHAVSLSDKYGHFRTFSGTRDGSGIYSVICSTNGPLRLTREELEAHPQWKQFGKDRESHPPMQGWLAAPFCGRDGKNLGLIQLSDRVDGDFTEDDEAILVQLANIASVAIENGRLYEALRDADRRKDEFLAMLAHELRNPLAPIRNSLQILQLKKDPQLAPLSDMMTRQVEHMVRMVDDLLDVSRITRGKIKLHVEVVDLQMSLLSAIEVSRPAMEARHQIFQISLPTSPLMILGDPTRLTQIVVNLLNNASKFTQENGTISLTGEVANQTVILRIRDNGIGIATAILPRIFDLFVQADRTLDRSHGGLGIGLTLVKSLVGMHGGTVEVQSEGSGKGSEFTVRLPLTTTPLAPAAPEQTVVSSPISRKILVVDDNRDSADSLALLLSMFGHVAEVAYDGREALTLLQRFPAELVLLDIGLPGMSGYEVVRHIRRNPQLKGLTVVALTGYGSEEDRRLTAEAGFDAHLIKPVDPPALKDLLEKLRPRG